MRIVLPPAAMVTDGEGGDDDGLGIVVESGMQSV
jgi:hypothetical protein